MTVHIANTDFEFELAAPNGLTLEKSLLQRSQCLQLQFLPLLFADANDYVAVTYMPDQSYLDALQAFLGKKLASLALISDTAPFLKQQCYAWGPSLNVKAWADERQMLYAMPDWQIVQKINSKAFSHTYTSFKEAALLWNQTDLKDWIQSFQGAKVIKNCFGLSGMGHRFVNEKLDSLLTFCHREWKAGLPVIGEPWLKRVLDFSTQWFLAQDGTVELLGTTIFETTPKGTYLGTLVGDEQTLFPSYASFMDEHKGIVRDMLLDLFKLGYFGHVGVDALLYQNETNELCLYPIVEINGRQTISLAALRLQQHYFPDKVMRMAFTASRDRVNLLPSSLVLQEGERIHFHKVLTIELVCLTRMSK